MSELDAANESYCPQCGRAVDSDARFCKHCAHDLTKPSPDSSADIPKISSRINSRMLYLALLAAVGLVIFALLGTYFYRRNRAQSTTVASSPTIAVPTVSDKAKQVEEKILSSQALSEGDLPGLSSYELRVLRNVHFARYGRKYDQGGELGGYFYTRAWYKPSDTYADNMITVTDKANINLILAQERATNNAASNSGGVASKPSATAEEDFSETDDDTEPNSGLSGLAGEGMKKAQQAFSQLFTKCGDKYNVQCNGLSSCPGALNVDQYTNPSFTFINIKNITEADRLNGVEFAGTVQIGMGAARRSICNKGWSSWSNRNEDAAPRIGLVDVVKRGSSWSTDLHPSFNHSRIACSTVPN